MGVGLPSSSHHHLSCPSSAALFFSSPPTLLTLRHANKTRQFSLTAWSLVLACLRCTPNWDCLAVGAGPLSDRSRQPLSSRCSRLADDAKGIRIGRPSPIQKPNNRVGRSASVLDPCFKSRLDTMPKAESGHESWIMLGLPFFYQSDFTDGGHPISWGSDCLRHPITISLSSLLPPFSSQAL